MLTFYISYIFILTIIIQTPLQSTILYYTVVAEYKHYDIITRQYKQLLSNYYYIPLDIDIIRPKHKAADCEKICVNRSDESKETQHVSIASYDVSDWPFKWPECSGRNS